MANNYIYIYELVIHSEQSLKNYIAVVIPLFQFYDKFDLHICGVRHNGGLRTAWGFHGKKFHAWIALRSCPHLFFSLLQRTTIQSNSRCCFQGHKSQLYIWKSTWRTWKQIHLEEFITVNNKKRTKKQGYLLYIRYEKRSLLIFIPLGLFENKRKKISMLLSEARNQLKLYSKYYLINITALNCKWKWKWGNLREKT